MFQSVPFSHKVVLHVPVLKIALVLRLRVSTDDDAARGFEAATATIAAELAPTTTSKKNTKEDRI